MKVYSVRECSSLVAGAFQKDYIFKNITISGTVSNLRFHFSGVIFFSLIDEESRITCRIGKMRSAFLGRRIKNGTEILILGNIKYEKISGRPIFQVDRILSSTESPILEKLDMLKKELKASGYFDIEKKKRLPLFPFRVGIVTSASGAVIHDIIRTGFLRNNSVRYSLYSTTVQGENAAADMAEMVIRANEETEPPDILIIARGGGSEEDLTPFNQRVLLDAVFCSKIPVISAVGHETDFSISDFVADLRAPTPSAAAELAVPDIDELKIKLNSYNNRYKVALKKQLEYKRLKYEKCMTRRVFKEPLQRINESYLHVDTQEKNIENKFKLKIMQKRSEFQNVVEKIDALSPLKTLSRGYSIMEKNGKIVKSKKELNIGDEVNIKLYEGTTKAKII